MSLRKEYRQAMAILAFSSVLAGDSVINLFRGNAEIKEWGVFVFALVVALVVYIADPGKRFDKDDKK